MISYDVKNENELASDNRYPKNNIPTRERISLVTPWIINNALKVDH